MGHQAERAGAREGKTCVWSSVQLISTGHRAEQSAPHAKDLSQRRALPWLHGSSSELRAGSRSRHHSRAPSSPSRPQSRAAPTSCWAAGPAAVLETLLMACDGPDFRVDCGTWRGKRRGSCRLGWVCTGQPQGWRLIQSNQQLAVLLKRAICAPSSRN